MPTLPDSTLKIGPTAIPSKGDRDQIETSFSSLKKYFVDSFKKSSAPLAFCHPEDYKIFLFGHSSLEGEKPLDHSDSESEGRGRKNDHVYQCRSGHRLDGEKSAFVGYGPTGPQHHLDGR